MELLGILSKGSIERIAYNSCLPGQNGLGGIRGLPKGEPVKNESSGENSQVRCAGEIRLVDTTHGDRDALGQKRPDPISGSASQAGRAERMQMIGEGAGHEFHSRTRERPRNMLVIPSAVKGDLAHGKT